MAAVERVLVVQGWHIPRWRTTNKDYGNFYQQRQLHTHSPNEPLQQLPHRPPHIHPVVDYINCNDRCYRPPQLRQHPATVHLHSSSSSLPTSSHSCHESAPLVSPFVRPAYQGAGLNAHIEHLTLQEERPPGLREPEQLPCRHPDESRDGSMLDERSPWKPKPLKPMILFEKKAKELEKERILDRQMPYKRKKSGEWLQAPLPPNKRQQTNYNIPREAQSISCIHPASRRYNYYKYYGYGGQGAKTSWGHNLPLGQKPPFSKRTRDLVT